MTDILEASFIASIQAVEREKAHLIDRLDTVLNVLRSQLEKHRVALGQSDDKAA